VEVPIILHSRTPWVAGPWKCATSLEVCDTPGSVQQACGSVQQAWKRVMDMQQTTPTRRAPLISEAQLGRPTARPPPRDGTCICIPAAPDDAASETSFSMPPRLPRVSSSVSCHPVTHHTLHKRQHNRAAHMIADPLAHGTQRILRRRPHRSASRAAAGRRHLFSFDSKEVHEQPLNPIGPRLIRADRRSDPAGASPATLARA